MRSTSTRDLCAIPRMILLLGASGYIGRMFAGELHRRGSQFVSLSRQALNYTDFNVLFTFMRKVQPTFVINAAGYTHRPDRADSEEERAAMLRANTILPQTIARACLMTQTPWGHVSSAGIYAGAKIKEDGDLVIERDFSQPELLRLLASCPEKIRGFTERDEPNSTFRQAPCSFLTGTKALAEEAIRGVGRGYIWRLGTPFNERAEAGNFLHRLQNQGMVQDDLLALSHTADFVQACLELWEKQAPFGTYNLTNPGSLTLRQLAQKIECLTGPDNQLEFWQDTRHRPPGDGQNPAAHCVLDSGKLLATGVKLRPVTEAVVEAVNHWQAQGHFAEAVRSAA